jgi:hypothetical protein
MTPLVQAAQALGVKHKANRAGDMVILGSDYGTEGADHGLGAEVSCIAADDYTVVGHEDDGDYRNIGSYSTAQSALAAALAFVRKSG